MDERNAKIADGLKYADDMKAQLERPSRKKGDHSKGIPGSSGHRQ